MTWSSNFNHTYWYARGIAEMGNQSDLQQRGLGLKHITPNKESIIAPNVSNQLQSTSQGAEQKQSTTTCAGRHTSRNSQ